MLDFFFFGPWRHDPHPHHYMGNENIIEQKTEEIVMLRIRNIIRKSLFSMRIFLTVFLYYMIFLYQLWKEQKLQK